jgi:hypothetical protein
MRGLGHAVVVGLAVTAVTVPLGLAGALILDRLSVHAAALLAARCLQKKIPGRSRLSSPAMPTRYACRPMAMITSGN